MRRVVLAPRFLFLLVALTVIAQLSTAASVKCNCSPDAFLARSAECHCCCLWPPDELAILDKSDSILPTVPKQVLGNTVFDQLDEKDAQRCMLHIVSKDAKYDVSIPRPFNSKCSDLGRGLIRVRVGTKGGRERLLTMFRRPVDEYEGLIEGHPRVQPGEEACLRGSTVSRKESMSDSDTVPDSQHSVRPEENGFRSILSSR